MKLLLLLLLIVAIPCSADVIDVYNVRQGDTVTSNCSDSINPPLDVWSESDTFQLGSLASTTANSATFANIGSLMTTLKQVCKGQVDGQEVIELKKFVGVVPTSWPSDITYIQMNWKRIPAESVKTDLQVTTAIQKKISSSSAVTQSQLSSVRAVLNNVSTVQRSAENTNGRVRYYGLAVCGLILSLIAVRTWRA